MVEFKTFKILDLFTIKTSGKKRGKQDINKKGVYPLYTSQIQNKGVIGFMETYDLDIEKNLILFGDHTRNVEIITGKFSISDNVKLLEPKYDTINLEYIKYVWGNSVENLGYSRHWKLARTKVFEMPINPDGSFNLEVQEEIANKYKQVETVKQQIEEKLAELSKVKVIVDIEDLKETTEFKKFKIEDILDSMGGNSKYNSKFIKENSGLYPVYSAKIEGDKAKGFINTFDYDLECLQMTTNGVNAGTVIYRPKGMFSVASDARIYKPKHELLDTLCLLYLNYVLGIELSKENFSWTKKATANRTNNIEIEIPVNTDGSFNIGVQESIANRYKQIDDVQFDLLSKLKELKKLKITI